MTLRRTLKRIVDHLSALDLYQVRFIPDGADEPRPPVPNVVQITPSDVERARAEWNELFPEYAGLLDAEVKGQRDF